MSASAASAKWIGEFCSWAFLMNTGWVSSFHSPITTGIWGLMIPAFSSAISPSVFPRNWVWSKLMFVITDRIGVMMLVLSSLPPNPTSMTAKSTFVLQNTEMPSWWSVQRTKDVAVRRISGCFLQSRLHTLRLPSHHLRECVL